MPVMLYIGMEELSGTALIPVAEIPEPITEEESIAKGILPYLPGSSSKQEYLALRACGFSIREAIAETGVTQRTVERWRQSDSLFAYYDSTGLAELRKLLGNKVILVEFTRNFHRVLRKDLSVLEKPITELTPQEHQYLVRRAASYSPEQLERLQRIAKTGQVDDKDIGSLIKELGIQRRKLTITETETERRVEVEE